jgi:hypothetical protein
MSIPSHHNPGDAGHAADHNAIVDELTSQSGAIATLQSTTVGLFYVAGGNVTNITDATTIWSRINLPTGDRSAAPDTLQVFHGANKIFWLDNEGKPRVKNDDSTHIPWVVDAVSGQTANLEEWRVNGVVKALIDKDGNLTAPNMNWSAWTNLTYSSGITTHTSLGVHAMYRTRGDEVQIRGNVSKTSGADFSSSPTDICVLPAGIIPTATVYAVCGSEFGGTEHSVRLEVRTDGTLRAYYGYTPNWMSLDGIRYSKI